MSFPVPSDEMSPSVEIEPATVRLPRPSVVMLPPSVDKVPPTVRSPKPSDVERAGVGRDSATRREGAIGADCENVAAGQS